MSDKSQHIPLYEKIGYSAADAAANFVFMTMVLFQANFYTDVMKITAASAGWIVLIARLWDAFFDPVMGITADRTRTRWGRFRPWVLWTALPWGIIMYLAYMTPTGWTGSALFVYALITNILLMTLYSANNMPYAALGGVMTADVQERSKLNAFRFVAVNIAQFIVGGFTLVLVAKFAGQPTALMPKGNVAHGWEVTMGIYAVICVVCFVITFATTKERVKPIAEAPTAPGVKKSSGIKQDFSSLLKNGPWAVMFFMTLIHFAILPLRGAASYNYYHKYTDKAALYNMIEPLGLTAKLPMFSSAAVDPATNTIDLKDADGLTTGEKIKYNHGFDKEEEAAQKVADSAKAAGLPAPPKFNRVDIGGLVDGGFYYVNVNAGKVKLYDTKDNAIAGGTAGLVHLQQVSTGTQHELVPQTLAEWCGIIVHGDPKQDLEHSTVADVGNSLINMLGTAVTIVAIMFSPMLAKRFGKKVVCVVGFALVTINAAAFYFIPKDAVGAMIALTITNSLFYGPTIPLVWAIYADVVDYHEWKTGRRVTGIVFATIGFALKSGLALGTSAFLWIMAANDSDHYPMSDAVIEAVRKCNTIYPALLFAACTTLLIVYKINKKMTQQIADELAQRRQQAETGAPVATA